MPEVLPNQSDQNFLYQLICSQLENDGFLKSAQCLQVELNSMPDKLAQGDKLEKLVNMCIQIKQHIDCHTEGGTDVTLSADNTESSMDADSTNQEHKEPPLTEVKIESPSEDLSDDKTEGSPPQLSSIQTTDATSSSEALPKLDLEKEELLKQQLFHQQLILQQLQQQQQHIGRDDPTKRLSEYMLNCYKSDYSMLRDTSQDPASLLHDAQDPVTKMLRDPNVASMLRDPNNVASILQDPNNVTAMLRDPNNVTAMLRDPNLLSPFLSLNQASRPVSTLASNLPDYNPNLTSLNFAIPRSSPGLYTARSTPGSYSLSGNKSPLNIPARSSHSTPTTPTFKDLSPLYAEEKKDQLAPQTSNSPDKSPAPTSNQTLSIKTEEELIKSTPKYQDVKGKPGDNDRKRFPCRFCGRRFTQQSALQVHERTHTGEKPYHCHYCDKAFTQISNLKCHERLHTGEKPYRCQLCGKRFTQSASLRCHMRSHTGERPYHCKYCQKRFTQPASLQHHIRIHTGEKPYQCEHCGKSFTQPSSLVVHRRLHTGERPFVCQICGKSYTQAMPLKEHMRTHHLTSPPTNKDNNLPFNMNKDTNLSFNMSSPFSLQVNQLQNSMAQLPLFLSSKFLPNFPPTSTSTPQLLLNHQNTAFQSVPKPDTEQTIDVTTESTEMS